VIGWMEMAAAKKEILAGIKRFQSAKKKPKF
jgi:hypothetical protein